MIYIDLNTFIPSDEWRYTAFHLDAELKSKSSIDERIQFIDDNRTFWSQLKNQFPYSDKCWYSEAKESVSIYEVEHFRPTKATVKTASVLKGKKGLAPFEELRKDWIKATKYKGGGYWWLAFNYKNYRNCGKKINSIKSIRFPLRLKSFIAYLETDDYTKEDVILLDPTKEGDPELLTFEPDGKVKPTITDSNDSRNLRAFVSIDVYGLNKIDALVKHRETKWADCYKAIRRAMDKFNEIKKSESTGDLISFHRFFNEFMDFVENDIKPAIEPTSQFSSVAKACVLSYSSYDWINQYVLA